MRISDWSSDVCSSDLLDAQVVAASEGVILGNEVHRTAAGANRDGDALAVRQGDDQRSAGDRGVDRGGVNDGAAFSCIRGRGERNGAGVDGIGDIGHGRSRAWHQVRSEEHTSELQSLMRISYAVFCLKKK